MNCIHCGSTFHRRLFHYRFCSQMCWEVVKRDTPWFKRSLGPMPQCVKATLCDRVDILDTMPAGRMRIDVGRSAFSNLIRFDRPLLSRHSRFNNLCLRIGYPLPGTHRLLSVG